MRTGNHAQSQLSAGVAQGQRRPRRQGGRAHTIRVRVSGEERDLLAQRAQALGVSMSRMLMESALTSGGPSVAERRAAMAELMALRRLLGDLGSNLAEAVRLLRGQGGSSKTVEPVSVALAQATARLDRILTRYLVPGFPEKASDQEAS